MKNDKDNILYIDDEIENLSGFKYVFKKYYNIFTASTAKEGVKLLRNNKIKVLISDQRMPKMTGVQLLELAATEFPKVYRIILTAYTDVQDIILAINKGKIYQFIRKPWDKDEVKIIIDNAIKSYNLKEENENLFEKLKLANLKLEKANKSLEEKVIERTKELNIKNKELEKHRNNLEYLIKIRTKDLEIALQKAEESDKLKTAFLSNVSHEIRTPMNAIIGFAELLLKPDYTDAEKNEFKDQVIFNANTLLRLIDDILDIAKIEANQITIRYENYDLNQLLEDIYMIFQKQILDYNKKITLNLNKPSHSKPFIIKTDKIRLNQVMSNLIGNAIKFTDEGSVSFGYKIIQDTNEILFHVKDSGIGISKDMQEVIFNRFRKVSFNSSKLYRGTGLGLFITKSLIDLLNGKIWVESEENKGSSFFFKIPYLPFDEKIENENIIKTKLLPEVDFGGKSILVAEDEDSSYLFIEKSLRKTNANLIRAFNGEEAVNILKDNNIDLILMDMQMPVMNGYRATQIVKKINKNIPVIAQTAFAMAEQKEKIFKIGCDDYLAKPLNSNELINTILKYI